MHELKQYWVAEALEKDLGEPLDPNSVISFQRAIAIDESEEFPHQEITWLYNWKLQHHYVPSDCGENLLPLKNLLLLLKFSAVATKLSASPLRRFFGRF